MFCTGVAQRMGTQSEHVQDRSLLELTGTNFCDRIGWLCRAASELSSRQRAVGQLLGGHAVLHAHGAGVQPGARQHPAVPQEAAQRSAQVAAATAYTAGRWQIVLRAPSDSVMILLDAALP